MFDCIYCDLCYLKHSGDELSEKETLTLIVTILKQGTGKEAESYSVTHSNSYPQNLQLLMQSADNTTHINPVYP